MSIRCVIIDDEPLACEVLQSYVERIDSMELVATCNNAIDAFDVLKKEEVDLLFLDIQMPKLTGIEFMKVINPAPKVIFTTAYREYAVESYELNVVDYLLKPIAFDRFLMAINKVVENEHTVQEEKISDVQEDKPYLFLKSDRKMVKIFLEDIAYVESLKDYVRIKISDGSEVVSLQKISYLEQKLPEDCFLRIHRSFIVPIKKIDAFSSTNVEIAGKDIPIGRNYKSDVMKRLNEDRSIIK
jgi:DNA-binding LytR/AlgR family response regulator